MDRSTPAFPVPHQPQSLLRLKSIESVMPSNHLILCRPLFLLPSIFPSIRAFSNESAVRIRWPINIHYIKCIVKTLSSHPALIRNSGFILVFSLSLFVTPFSDSQKLISFILYNMCSYLVGAPDCNWVPSRAASPLGGPPHLPWALPTPPQMLASLAPPHGFRTRLFRWRKVAKNETAGFH